MIDTKDKKGQWVYVTCNPDCEENEGGLYCEVYADEYMDRKIDDFCIHKGEYEMTAKGVEKFIKDYCKETEFDLNFKF